MDKTSFLKREPTEKELKRGKSEAIVLGAIIGVVITSTIEYFLNVKIPAIIKWLVIVGGLSFLSQKFLGKHLGKKITFQKQNEEYNNKPEPQNTQNEVKITEHKKSKKGLVWTGVIIVAVIFIVAVFSELPDEQDIELAQTDKSGSYSEQSGNLYRNTKYDFRIKFPGGWDIKAGDGPNILQKAVNGNHTMSIGVREIPAEYGDKTATIKNVIDLAEFKNSILGGVQEKFPGAKLIDYGESKLDNEPAYWIKYSMPYTALDITVEGTQLQYQVLNNNIFYFITAGSTSNEFQSVEAELMKSISTFVIENY
ncbi:MAG: PsbP-related protein [Candidatus Magasanikbacteria bacterium]|nr:hypothetical protein [Patescibacteria group bacterium]MBU1349713.1 hypothetical protein [Patescibacteria group bacterium]MBU1586299.1 hypothetical protein [Pseudomonadota bacterium]MBU2416284.1 hypothetical protein [Patescibacteria group bacterium]